MSFLQSKNFQIIPYSPEYWKDLAGWYYNDKYLYFFRHHGKAYTQQEFENFPQITGAQFFILVDPEKGTGVGLIQFTPDCKNNKAFYIGILLDESVQGNRYPLEAFDCFFNYAFNRLGYRKAIIEILENHSSLKKIVTENGFLFEGKLYNECFLDGEYVNELRYCMMDSFYNKKFRAKG